MLEKVTFFSFNKRTKELKKGDIQRRIIILEMLRKNIPLTTNELARECDIARSTTFEIIESFIKSGLVTRKRISSARAINHEKHTLTNDGVLVGLAVYHDSKDKELGIKTTSLLEQAFQPTEKMTPVMTFTCLVMLNALNRGLEDYVLRFVTNLAKLKEKSSKHIDKQSAFSAGETVFSEDKSLKGGIISALNSLDPKDRDEVVQYYRNLIINFLFQMANASHNRKISNLATQSQRDPDALYIQLNCTCRYHNECLRVTMEDVFMRIFSGKWYCPKCGKGIKKSKKESVMPFMV